MISAAGFQIVNLRVRQRFAKWYVRDGQGVLVPAPPDSHNEQRTREIFAGAMTSIKDAVRAITIEETPVGVVSVPSYFNASSARSAFSGVEDVDQDKLRVWQRGRYHQITRHAYGLNSCAGLGLDATCDMDEGPHLIIYVIMSQTF